jgi:hypothetical protein
LKKLKITIRGSLRVSAAPGANYSLPKTTGDVTSRVRELLGRIFFSDSNKFFGAQKIEQCPKRVVFAGRAKVIYTHGTFQGNF